MNNWILLYLTIGFSAFLIISTIYFYVLYNLKETKITKQQWIEDYISLFIVITLFYPLVILLLVTIWIISIVFYIINKFVKKNGNIL